MWESSDIHKKRELRQGQCRTKFLKRLKRSDGDTLWSDKLAWYGKNTSLWWAAAKTYWSLVRMSRDSSRDARALRRRRSTASFYSLVSKQMPEKLFLCKSPALLATTYVLPYMDPKEQKRTRPVDSAPLPL